MKNLLVLVALITAFSASARSIHPLTYVLSANLTEAMNIDQDSYLNNMEIFGGRVEIKQLKREISLQLHIAPQCPVGFACPEVLRIHEVKLPITHQFTDNCNNTTYIAARDDRPVDGIYESVSVTDHTFNRCPTFQALPATSVLHKTFHYDRLNGREVTTHSSFEADKLKGRSLPVILPMK